MTCSKCHNGHDVRSCLHCHGSGIEPTPELRQYGQAPDELRRAVLQRGTPQPTHYAGSVKRKRG